MRRPEHTPARGASSRTDHARTASRRLIGGSRLRDSPAIQARLSASVRAGYNRQRRERQDQASDGAVALDCQCGQHGRQPTSALRRSQAEAGCFARTIRGRRNPGRRTTEPSNVLRPRVRLPARFIRRGRRCANRHPERTKARYETGLSCVGDPSGIRTRRHSASRCAPRGASGGVGPTRISWVIGQNVWMGC